MQGSSVFDQLVLELTEGERADMLNRLTELMASETEPVHSSDEDPPPVNLETEYTGFSLPLKIIIFLRTVFTSKTRIQLIEAAVMKSIYSKLEDIFPGLYDFPGKRIHSALLLEVKNLKKAVNVFNRVMVNVNMERKEEIFAFVMHRELPEIETRVRQLCRVEKFVKTGNEAVPSEKELGRQIIERFEDFLMEMTTEERGLLSRDARFFQILQELTFFPFDKLIAKFGKADDQGCVAADLADDLQLLTRIFMSMTHLPSPGFLEALFIINHLNDDTTELDDLFSEVKSDMIQARDAVRAMRQFNRNVPLFDLLRLASEKANVYLKPVTAGEDWSSLVRSYWRRRLKGEVKRFLINREYHDLEGEAAETLGLEQLPRLPYYRHEVHTVPLELNHISSLSFLNAFTEYLLSGRHNILLKQVLIDGEFYKAQNSEDYSDSYNGLNLLKEKMKDASDFLSPRGSGGLQLAALDDEAAPSFVRKRKISSITAEADRRAAATLSAGLDLIRMLGAVLNGILHGEKGGRFDSLSNIGYMGGRNNDQFMKDLNSASIALNEAARILAAMIRLEERYAASA